MEKSQIKNVVEAALLAAGRPLNVDQLRGLFGDDHPPERQEIRQAVEELEADYAGRGIAIGEVASGFRIQVRDTMTPWLARLWEERAPRYSRALMETLAIVAYRQPVTRGDVEQIRGVAVTTNIMRTLLERGWIKVVGYRDVPGKPAMYGTTREFLDYFSLKQLDELPPLAEIRDLDRLGAQLDLTEADFAAIAESGDTEAHLVAAPEAPLPEEPATVASIEVARAAAHPVPAAGAEADAPVSATVIPLKAR
ncbi:MAG: SMC-Scp complex subunit ScpB [Gammaproteobacteria bacterium]|nr:SMC-Scp complex subunit ScpB [Gammaproteobacteria bacterium]